MTTKIMHYGLKLGCLTYHICKFRKTRFQLCDDAQLMQGEFTHFFNNVIFKCEQLLFVMH